MRSASEPLRPSTIVLPSSVDVTDESSVPDLLFEDSTVIRAG